MIRTNVEFYRVPGVCALVQRLAQGGALVHRYATSEVIVVPLVGEIRLDRNELELRQPVGATPPFALSSPSRRPSLVVVLLTEAQTQALVSPATWSAVLTAGNLGNFDGPLELDGDNGDIDRVAFEALVADALENDATAIPIAEAGVPA